jgi:SAM-dependent methyltransferase
MNVVTDHPLALDSNDHLHPWGARRDDTTCPAFLKACEREFPHLLSYLDLGCAGGGLVREFLDAGHYAIGIDGSDTPRKLGRWDQYPDNFITADISRIFALGRKFSVISAWEVMEHMFPERLPVLFANIRNHLTQGGIFVCSISLKPDVVNGIVYHQTVQSEDWWRKQFVLNGLVPTLSPFSRDEYARTDPLSCHLVARSA